MKLSGKFLAFFVFKCSVEVTFCSLFYTYLVPGNSNNASAIHEGLDPSETVASQMNQNEEQDTQSPPLFYGWFYNDEVSESLNLISAKYLANCYDYIPEFSSFLDKAMYNQDVSDPFAYFVKPFDPDTGRMTIDYHTTAKFCGITDCSEYTNRVQEHVGKNFEMHLIGLFFTTRTYGVRVKLTPKEQDIFEIDERKNTMQAVELLEMHLSDYEVYRHNAVASPEHNALEGFFHLGMLTSSYPMYPGIRFDPQTRDYHPTESRSHITIGCSMNIPAVQTGLDLLEIIDMEISSHIYHQDFEIGGGDVPFATLRQYGGDGEGDEVVFVIYPEEKMVTNAIFQAYF